VHIVSLTLGFASAGVAGVLLGMMELFSPFIGFPLAIAAFIVVILGGLGHSDVVGPHAKLGGAL
tara:strand:+ start:363 stop:554 length:192 start_codon:yes stop_codon:yes gene_type:complete